jgi:hypothetical protein
MVSGKLLMPRPSSVKDCNDDSKEILSGSLDKVLGITEERNKISNVMKAGLENTLCKVMEGS